MVFLAASSMATNKIVSNCLTSSEVAVSTPSRIRPMLAPLCSAAVLIAADTGASTEFIDRYREIMALAPRRDSIADVTTSSFGATPLRSPVQGDTLPAVPGGRPDGRRDLPWRRTVFSRTATPGRAPVSAPVVGCREYQRQHYRNRPALCRFHAEPAAQLVISRDQRRSPGDLRGHVHDLLKACEEKRKGP